MLYTIYLKTYSGCQLNCDHCMTNGKSGGHTYFNLEKTKDWFHRLDQFLPKEDAIHVELFGGEPLMGKLDDIIEVSQYLRQLERSISIGMTSNLVLKLSDKAIDFLLSLDGLGTSWDASIRFENEKQYKLWVDNVRLINLLRDNTTLNISLTREVLQVNPADLLLWSIQLGFSTISFERITTDGLAVINDVIPSNKLVSDWYLRLHQETIRRKLRKQIYNKTLEDVYAKFENSDSTCGTFCRDCETKMFTINADGTISGCPNSATKDFYGDIDQPIHDLFNQPKRIEMMTKEAMRSDFCYECGIFEYCGSDCHRLAWNGKICPAPKELMILLKKGYENG